MLNRLNDLTKGATRLSAPTYPWLIMGVLNLTEDSFYPASRIKHLDALMVQAEKMLAAGAHILDLGAVSSRPGALPLALPQELDRLLPAVERISGSFDCGLSIDTSQVEVMRACLPLGISMINDINALQAKGACQLVSGYDVDVCLMHKQGEPATMQVQPQYENVVTEVFDFLAQRVDACLAAGIQRHTLCVDPGFGFGKTVAHNVALLKSLHVFKDLGVPLLVGLSRKALFDALFKLEVEQRLLPSVVAALLAQQKGARIVRVHDVAQTRQALALAQYVN
jgi:dihydropteroate synthase